MSHPLQKHAIPSDIDSDILPSPDTIKKMIKALELIASGQAWGDDMTYEARQALDLVTKDRESSRTLQDLLDEAWKMGRDHVVGQFDETARKIDGFSDNKKKSLGHSVVAQEITDQQRKAAQIRSYQPPADLADRIMAPLLPLFAKPSEDDGPSL